VDFNREALVDELVRDEALRLKLYTDSKGIPSIGIGRNLLVGISKGEAFYLCNNDIDTAEGELDHTIAWWRELDDVRQRILLNMCFNMGIARLSGFHQFFGQLRAKNWMHAAEQMVASKWHADVGARAERLETAMRLGVMP
jgi:lysozyme